jgi:flagellar protein FliS
VGANAYARVGTEIGAMSASPHQLITMLFDGARTAIGMAQHHLARKETSAKGNAISKAINIIDNGLKASLDAEAGGPAGATLAADLAALYDYINQRLMYANLRNDPALLDEASRLLESIASAWREIGPAPAAAIPDSPLRGSAPFSIRG